MPFVLRTRRCSLLALLDLAEARLSSAIFSRPSRIFGVIGHGARHEHAASAPLFGQSSRAHSVRHPFAEEVRLGVELCWSAAVAQ